MRNRMAHRASYAPSSPPGKEAHGGAIDVRSVDGQGSTFAVRLPVAA